MKTISDLPRLRRALTCGLRVELTDAGREYVASCRRVLEDIAEIERIASGEYRVPQGELVISAPVFLSRTHILPVLVDFLAAYPDIKVQLLQSDRAVNLLEERVDLAVRLGALPDSSLVATRVGLVRRVLCAAPRYLEARGTPGTPEDLSGHDCIAFEALNASDFGFRKVGADDSVPIRPRLTVSTAEVATAAALAGVGIARLLSCQVAEYVTNGQLNLVLEEYEPATLALSMVYPSRRQVPLKLRAFLDFATPRLREMLGYRPV